jgi:hypothetical protein
MFLKNLKIGPSYNPAIPLTGICLKECKSEYNEDTWTSMFCKIIHNNQAMEKAQMLYI